MYICVIRRGKVVSTEFLHTLHINQPVEVVLFCPSVVVSLWDIVSGLNHAAELFKPKF